MRPWLDYDFIHILFIRVFGPRKFLGLLASRVRPFAGFVLGLLTQAIFSSGCYNRLIFLGEELD